MAERATLMGAAIQSAIEAEQEERERAVEEAVAAAVEDERVRWIKATDEAGEQLAASLTAAVAEAVAAERAHFQEAVWTFDRGYKQGQRDERDACIAALEAAGHTRYGIYDECECPEEVRQQEGHLIYLEEFAGCEKSLVYYGCRECCTDDGYHSEACATYHEHGEDKPYCKAVAAIRAQGEA